MKFTHEEMLNLPDILFARLCESKFAINKGVYNTIDNWFFEKGIVQITSRRELILTFFQSIYIQQTKVKFGPGGLTMKLDTFWTQQMNPQKYLQVN